MAGSATTFLRKNPSFNVIELDEATMLPVNIKTYYFNISNATDYPKKPQWEYLHDYIQTYLLHDMSPDSIFNRLALRVLNEEQVALEYNWNKFKKSAVKKPKKCSADCRRKMFCEITQPEQMDFNVCMGQPQYDFINEPIEALGNLLTAEWVKRTTPEPKK
jgi:hypothetical protein